MTVANKPGHRGEHEVSRKTIARGVPGNPGVTVVTTRVLSTLHTRLRAHQAPGIPCALQIRGQEILAKLVRIGAAGSRSRVPAHGALFEGRTGLCMLAKRDGCPDQVRA